MRTFGDFLSVLSQYSAKNVQDGEKIRYENILR